MKDRAKMDKMRRAAALDMARLHSDDLSGEDERAIAQRQGVDELYQKEFVGIAEVLSDMTGLADSEVVQSVLEGREANRRQRNTHAAYSVRWGIAAGLLLAIAVGYMAYPTFQSQFELNVGVDRYVTRVGEQKSVALPDGSMVNLNTNSEVLISYSESGRKLTVKRGEAFFDVAKDENRPFSVDVGGRSVTVLGTAFNIRKEADSFTLAVVEGLVVLHDSDEAVDASANLLTESGNDSVALDASLQYRLGAGWVAKFDEEHSKLASYRQDSIGALYQWRSGLLSFEGVPLYKVAQELNRYSPKKILIEDKSIMDLEVYAAVKVDRIQAALKGLEQSHAVKIKRYLDRIVIVGK